MARLLPAAVMAVLWGGLALRAEVSDGRGGGEGEEEKRARGVEVQLVPKNVRGYRHMISQPMLRSEIARYERYLRLSDEQSEYLNRLYEEYATKWNGLMESEWEDVQFLNEDAADCVGLGVGDPECVEAYAAFVEGDAKFQRTAERHEDELFSRLEAALADSQLELMWRVRADRQRARGMVKEWGVRGARLDYSWYVQEKMGLSPEELAEVDPMLMEYEREVTPARERVDDSVVGKRTEHAQLQGYISKQWSMREGEGRDEAGLVKATKEKKGLDAAELSDQLEVVRIQKRYLPRLSEKLPAHMAEMLQAKERAVLWPAVYPDHTDPEEVYERVAAREELGEEERRVLEETWRVYRRRYERISAAMRAGQERWDDMLMGRVGHTMGEWNTCKSEMCKRREERWEANSEMLAYLNELIPEDDASNRRQHRRQVDLIKVLRRRVNEYDSYPYKVTGAEE